MFKINKRTEVSILFSLVFLLTWPILCYQLGLLFNSSFTPFPLTIQKILQMVISVLIISVDGFCFIIALTLAPKWWLITPIIFIATLLPIILVPPAASYFISIGVICCMLLTFFYAKYKLTSYEDFKPVAILSPVVKTFVRLFILIIVFTYFLTISQFIKTSEVNNSNIVNTLNQHISGIKNIFQIDNNQNSLDLQNNFTNYLLDQKFTSSLNPSLLNNIVSSVLFFIVLNIILFILSFLIDLSIVGIFYLLDSFNIILIIDDTQKVKRWVSNIE